MGVYVPMGDMTMRFLRVMPFIFTGSQSFE